MGQYKKQHLLFFEDTGCLQGSVRHSRQFFGFRVLPIDSCQVHGRMISSDNVVYVHACIHLNVQVHQHVQQMRKKRVMVVSNLGQLHLITRTQNLVNI